MANEPVVFQYTFPGVATWFPLSSAFTDVLGYYNIQWINSATGAFTLKTEWAGNATHFSATNTTTLTSLPYQNQNVFFVESNSTITSLAFNSTSQALSFTVTGEPNTTGYVKVTIQKSIVANGSDLKVFLDGYELTYTLTESADSWALLFNYSHSTHQVIVKVDENSIVPEYTSWLTLSLVLILALPIIFYKKKLLRSGPRLDAPKT